MRHRLRDYSERTHAGKLPKGNKSGRLHKKMNRFAFILFAAVSTAGSADFEKDIRPLLQKHCVECHGEKKQKGELRLDAKGFTFKGGHDGPAIVPGKADASRF